MIQCAAESLTLRPQTAADEPLLFALYSSTRADELAITGWDAVTCDSFLRMQFNAQRLGYSQMFPQAQFYIILSADVPIGRIVVNRAVEEIRVVDFVIAPEERSRGAGTALMKGLITESAAAKKPLRLCVVRGNRALHFYERLGFSLTAESASHLEMERPPALSA
jgi:ribosomal protein S18 acetylase RimI-like enzyme